MDDAIAVSHKRTVYVGNLDEHVTEDLIRAAFVPFGEILSVNFPFDQYTSKSNCIICTYFKECTKDFLSLNLSLWMMQILQWTICTILSYWEKLYLAVQQKQRPFSQKAKQVRMGRKSSTLTDT